VDNNVVIDARDITKIYQMGDVQVRALRGTSFHVSRGELVAIMGPSGSGKSTLMNILGCLDQPTSGEYYLEGVEIDQLDDNQLADIRSKKIGFVFQTFNLLSRTTALSNVELPLVYGGVGGRRRHEQLPVDGLVAVAIVVQRPHHVCCVVHWSGHIHEVTSARRNLQG